MINAIFVDAAGHTREHAIEAALPVFRFIIPQSTSALVSVGPPTAPVRFDRQIAEFEPVGSLPDERLVYVQKGYQLGLAWAKASYPCGAPVEVTDAIDEELSATITRVVGVGPVRIVFDAWRDDRSRALRHRTVWFVGRKRDS